MNFEMKKEKLIEVANSKGYVVRKVQPCEKTKFGQADMVTIEGGQYKIIFITNVLHGVNYSKIIHVEDYLAGRNYRAQRYHLKFIPLVGAINGETFIELNKTA